MSITIKDIARMMNVSHTTVSRALNDSPLIKEDTKRKIKELAKAYNYVPNFSARSLVLSKSYNIGLFFSTLRHGTTANFFYDVITGVNTIIRDDFTLSVKGIDDYKDFHLITKRFFDGILLMSQSIEDDHFLTHIINQEIPVVVLNRDPETGNFPVILSDDKIGAFNATEYLVKRGHRTIGIIEGKTGFKTTQQRKQGFLDALEKHKIKYQENLCAVGNYELHGGYMAMQKLLRQENRPTAVFCSNDDMAVGAMKAILERKLRIPDDISLMGYDDNGYSAYLSPALTTVKRPINRISKDGAKKLLEFIDHPVQRRSIFYIPTELMERESVRQLY
jgi:LacI family transcriptional regulator